MNAAAVGALMAAIVALLLAPASAGATVPIPFFTEGFESGLGQFTAQLQTGNPPAWAQATTFAHSGTGSAFAPDQPAVTDNWLTTTAPISIPAGATLSFFHKFNLESTFDGGVVEVSIDGAAFQDIVAAGGTFAGGAQGYTGTISALFSSPIANRQAFTGNSMSLPGNVGGFVETIVNLGPMAGHSVSFRFRAASDNSVVAGSPNGWWVDDVTLRAPGPELTLTRAGLGVGNASSSPAGIDCGAICSAGYPADTSVTLTANAASGSGFDGWTGCDSPDGTVCTMTMSADKAVTANFDVPPQAYTASATGITPTGTSVAGTVNGGSGATTFQFEYGTDPGLASATTTPAGAAPTPNDVDQPVSQGLSGLTPGTRYYYRVDAANSAGSANGSIFNFKTPALAGVVITKHPDPVIETAKPKVKVRFEFGAAKTGAFECSLDTPTYTACTSPKAYRVKLGKHKFKVRALTAGLPGKAAKFVFRVVRK
jgi:Divergent InlB B-repeat domain